MTNKKDTTIQKYCKFCNGLFSIESGHWKVSKNAFLECKAHAKEVRAASRRAKNLESFGTETPLTDPSFKASVKSKREATMKERYGSSNAMHIADMKDRQMSTLMENYGVTSPAKSAEIREKIEKTCLEKYGKKTNLQIPSVVKKASESKKLNLSIILSDGRYLRDLCDTLGISKAWAYKVYRHSGEKVLFDYIENYEKRTSYLELRFIELMKGFKELSLFNRQPCDSVQYRPDFRIEHEGKVLYVNVDGLYWHGEPRVGDIEYHQKMRLSFEQSGLRLMQFGGDEITSSPEIVKSIVMNYFGCVQKVYARKCEIVTLTKKESDSFFRDNHLMGSFPAGSCYGLINGTDLAAAICVRSKGDSLHIERFCNKKDISVVGGFSRLLAHAIKEKRPRRVVSFCDMRYATGDSYVSCGFKEVSCSLSFRWSNGVNTYPRSSCVANMDDRGLTETQHANEKKWFRVYDAGQKKFIKELTNA